MAYLPLNFSDFQYLKFKCVSYNIISINQQMDQRTKIVLQAESEDIAYGLREDKIFKNYGHLSAILS